VKSSSLPSIIGQTGYAQKSRRIHRFRGIYRSPRVSRSRPVGYVRQKKPRREKKPILNLMLAINVDKKIIKSWGQFEIRPVKFMLLNFHNIYVRIFLNKFVINLSIFYSKFFNRTLKSSGWAEILDEVMEVG